MPPKVLSYFAIETLDVLNLGPVNIKSENAREAQLFGIEPSMLRRVYYVIGRGGIGGTTVLCNICLRWHICLRYQFKSCSE